MGKAASVFAKEGYSYKPEGCAVSTAKEAWVQRQEQMWMDADGRRLRKLCGQGLARDPSRNVSHRCCEPGCPKMASPTLRNPCGVYKGLKYIFRRSVHICFLFVMFCQHFCENRAITPGQEARGSQILQAWHLPGPWSVPPTLLSQPPKEKSWKYQYTLQFNSQFLPWSLTPLQSASKNKHKEEFKPVNHLFSLTTDQIHDKQLRGLNPLMCLSSGKQEKENSPNFFFFLFTVFSSQEPGVCPRGARQSNQLQENPQAKQQRCLVELIRVEISQ